MQVRWNSTNKMDRKFLTFKVALITLLESVEEGKVKGLTKSNREKLLANGLTDKEWLVLESLTVYKFLIEIFKYSMVSIETCLSKFLKEVLTPFEEATKVLSGSTYSTAGKAKIILKHLHGYLTLSENTRVDIIKSWLLEQYNKYFVAKLSDFEKLVLKVIIYIHRFR
jgi:hypothetical protein